MDISITVKLFSGLTSYLPDYAVDDQAELTFTQGVSVMQVIGYLSIPLEEIQIVMLNGAFLPEDKHTESLADGDVISIWPIIHGG